MRIMKKLLAISLVFLFTFSDFFISMPKALACPAGKVELNIKKVNAVTGLAVSPVGQARFTVQRWNDSTQKYDTLVTNWKDGDQLPSAYDPGKFKITETQAPSGYFLNTTPLEFTLGSGDTGHVTVKSFSDQPKGSIAVTKALAAGQTDTDTTFTFTLVCPGGSTLHSDAIHAGETYTFPDLAYGNYTLTEDSVDGYSSTPVFSGAITGGVVKVDSCSAKQVTCTNTKYVGSFRIKKAFLNNTGDSAKEFTVKIDGGPNNSVHKTLKITSSHGWYTVDNLPYGTYTVTEDSTTGYGLVSIVNSETSNSTVVIDDIGLNGDVTVTNQITGSVKFIKVVNGVDNDPTEFKLIIKKWNGTTFENYTTVTVSETAEKTIELPYGTYKVEEESNDEYLQNGISPTEFTVPGSSLRTGAAPASDITVNCEPQPQLVTVTVTNTKLFGKASVVKDVDNVTGDGTSFSVRIQGPEGFDHTVTVSESGGLIDGSKTGYEYLNKLLLGEYTVTEAPGFGYGLVGIYIDGVLKEDGKFTISRSNYSSKIAIKVTNTKLHGKIVVTKSIYGGTIQPGDTFTFQLYKADGVTPVGAAQTIDHASMTCMFDNLEYGNYVVKETGVFAGYSAEAVYVSGKAVKLESARADVSCTNTKLFGKASVVKDVDNITGDATVFSVRIQGPEGFDHTVAVSESGGLVDGSKTGYEYLSKLPFGEYTVTETPGFGYGLKGIYVDNALKSDGKFTVNSANYTSTIAVKAVNTKLYGEIVVKKSISNATAKSGDTFTFRLYKADGATPVGDAKTIDLATMTCTFDHLEYGSYIVKETSVSLGYTKDHEFDVGKAVQLESACADVTCTNTKLYGKIIVTKKISGGAIKAGETFTFVLYKADGVTQVGDAKTVDISNLTCTFDNLDYGTYVVKETNVPGNYTPEQVYVDGKTVRLESSELAITCTNMKHHGHATLQKVVDNAAGDSTPFTLRITGPEGFDHSVTVRASDGVIDSSKPGYEFLDNMPLGAYTVTETAAFGYDRVGIDNGTFIIDETNYSSTVAVRAVNTKLYGKIVVTKVVSGVEMQPGDVFTFQLYKADGTTPVGLPQTVGMGNMTATFNHLEYGTYVVKEINVPLGYTAEQAFVVGKTVQLAAPQAGETCTNDKVSGKIVVTKNISGGAIQPGEQFTFALYKADGTTPVGAPQTVDINHMTCTFDRLDYGTYVVKELNVPDDYKAEQAFVDGKTVQLISSRVDVTCTNEKHFGSMSLRKIVDNMSGDSTPFSVCIQGPEGFDHTITLSMDSGVIDGAKAGYEYLNNLPFGAYTVTETPAFGYDRVDIQNGTFAINSSNYTSRVAVKVVNTKLYGKIMVTKSVTGGTIKAGEQFTFALYKADGVTLARPAQTVDINNMTATFDHLEYGDYVVKEINIPVGYTAEQVYVDGKAVHLAASQYAPLTCTNCKIYGKIVVTKAFTDNDNPADGTQFTFSLWEGGTKIGDDQTLTWKAAGPNTVTFTGLEYGHTYTVKEASKAGYISVSGDVPVTIDAARKDITYTNTKQIGGLSIAKALDSFDGDTTKFSFNIQGPSFPSGGYDFELAGGQAQPFTDLLYGTYTITENPTAGYELTGISGGGGTQAGNVFTVNLSSTNQSFTVTASNRKRVSITITKAMLDGFTVTPAFDFTITGPGYDHVPFTLQLTSDPATATRTFDDLQYGDYTITELPKTGYAFASFTGDIGAVNGNSCTVTAAPGLDRDIQITATNRALGRLQVTKQSSYNNQLLGGAVFQVTSVADPAVTFQLTTSGVTDAAHEKGKALSGWIEPGDYHVQEITAPDGYAIDDRAPRTVTVLAGLITSGPAMVFTDTNGKVLVQKYSSYDRSGIGGVQFELLSAPPDAQGNAVPGSVVAVATTDPAGLAVFENLPIGNHYWVREIQQAPHYDIDRSLVIPVIAVLNPEAPQAEFINNPLGRVSLLKYDASTVVDGDYEHATKVGGATFGIYNNAACTGTPVATFTSSATGAVESVDLPFSSALSTYYVKELAPAPAGYLLNETPQSVTFTAPGQVLTLRFENTPNKGSLVFRKIDALTKAPLAGAEFALYADKALTTKVAGPATSGADGTFRFDNLQPGTYWLMETKAPTDYDLWTAPISFEVKAGVTNPAPVEVTDQYNPPDPYHTGTMDWNFIIIGGLAVLAGLALVIFTRRRKARSSK